MQQESLCPITIKEEIKKNIETYETTLKNLPGPHNTLEDIYLFARHKHLATGARWLADAPYHAHLVDIGLILMSHRVGMTDPVDRSICKVAYLHDVLEDTLTVPEELGNLVGPDLVGIVNRLTDLPTPGNRKARKIHDLNRLGDHVRELYTRPLQEEWFTLVMIIVKLADTISNTGSIAIESPKFFMETYYREMAARLSVIGRVLTRYGRSRDTPIKSITDPWTMAHALYQTAVNELGEALLYVIDPDCKHLNSYDAPVFANVQFVGAFTRPWAKNPRFVHTYSI